VKGDGYGWEYAYRKARRLQCDGGAYGCDLRDDPKKKGCSKLFMRFQGKLKLKSGKVLCASKEEN